MGHHPPYHCVALVDCNNFFVSCERVFDPKLVGKPVVILSNNDGCIVSRSNEAKAAGIAMGEPFFKARPRLTQHQVAIYSANFSLYSDMSQRVMMTLAQCAPQIEVYSVDEAFLDLSDIPCASLKHYGQHIQHMVWRWTGIPVTVGIAPTKTLAKVAVEIAKKSPKTRGVLNLISPRHQALALAKLPVKDVWGIGPQLSQRLARFGIHTALQLRDANDAWLLRHFSVMTMRTVYELRGIPCFQMHQADTPRKSLIYSRSFGQAITSLRDLEEAVATYTARAAEKMRGQGLAARLLQVGIRTNPFHPKEPQYRPWGTRHLPVPTDCTPELIHYAKQLLHTLYRPGYRYHKAGIVLLDLIPVNQTQQNLFDTPQHRTRWSHLLATLDRLNRTFGQGTVGYAAEGVTKTWRGQKTLSSPCYTTCWQELPVIALQPSASSARHGQGTR